MCFTKARTGRAELTRESQPYHVPQGRYPKISAGRRRRLCAPLLPHRALLRADMLLAREKSTSVFVDDVVVCDQVSTV